MSPTDFEGLLRQLVDGRVDFILVGGVAAVVHGSARATFDVVYRRSTDNLERLVGAVAGIRPASPASASGLQS